MRFTKPIPVKEIAEKYHCEMLGALDFQATGLNEIHKVQPGDITFVDVEKYYDKVLRSAASVIIINKKTDCPQGKVLLITEKPFEVYNALAYEYSPVRKASAAPPIDSTIHPSAYIEPNVVIGHNVHIGEDCYIQSGVYIGNDTIIGKRVRIEANTVIGTDAFYYKKEDGKFTRMHSCGRVIIHDDAEIGAGCTINKGVSGDTIIGEGTKFDCQIHIGHGAVIGKNCLFAAQVGVGGKTIIGDNVVAYGQVGIAQRLHIGDNCVILAKSGVSKDLVANTTFFGIPAREVRTAYRELAALRNIASKK
jgi:UDP-3-O-[3-hydroxymyristoyl] glucosamine N-acyltransferase